jgi:hypothetical protein
MAGASYGSPSKISGAEYARDPQLVSNFVPGENRLEKPFEKNDLLFYFFF